MRENNPTITEKPQSNLTRWGIYALILLMVFLLGLLPMWWQKRQVSQELEAAQKQLRKSEIKGLLTTSIVESKRGEYESARQDASEFYTRLRTETDKGDDSLFTKEERDKLKMTFDNRDSTITMLAQRDQASTERLTDIYVIYQQAMGQAQLPSASPSGASPTLQPTQ
ncbi:MAG: hypothetical protein H0V31_04230 [Acidobacteria bacterium]|nr:hypothetical protein [Acidobacteriota bacterium]